MNIRKEQKASYGKWFLTDVIRAVNTYDLIKPAEEVCVALSGGRDSTTLLYILWYLKNHSHLDFSLSALHVKTDEYDTGVLKELCYNLQVPYRELGMRVGRRVSARNVCSICSHLKRGAMVEALKGTGITKVAFGHNADDVAETLLMNIVYNHKLGSFTPKVEVADGGIVMIRPLIYLEGPLIRRLHTHFRLPFLSYTCPYAEKSARASARKAIARLEELPEMREFTRSVVAALENLDLTTLWAEVRGK
jgi:tRNA 2-thiocytidine biosynthesis protein TtcA